MLILVSDRPSCYKELAVRLLSHGIFSFLASYENAAFLCEKKDTGGVFLDCTDDLARGELLCRKLRAHYPEMPIAVRIAPAAIPDLPATRLIRTQNAERLFSEVLDFCLLSCRWQTGRLSTASLTVTANPDETVYMGYAMPISPRRHLILRCLLYLAPTPISSDDLIALCYPEGVQHIGNLSVQISAINRIAAEIDPRPLIVHMRGKGYCLREGIL